jgi:hypothetical protein
VANRLPGGCPYRQAKDPLTVGTDPDRALCVSGNGEDMHTPPGAVRQWRHRSLSTRRHRNDARRERKEEA